MHRVWAGDPHTAFDTFLKYASYYSMGIALRMARAVSTARRFDTFAKYGRASKASAEMP